MQLLKSLVQPFIDFLLQDPPVLVGVFFILLALATGIFIVYQFKKFLDKFLK